MHTITKQSPVLEQGNPISCRICGKLLILLEPYTVVARDKDGIKVGYLHSSCEPAWKEKNGIS
jgi:hypothetical protein